MVPYGRCLGRPILAVLLLIFGLCFGAAQAIAETSAPMGAASSDFGSYLADHQVDVTPFFSKNGTAINAALLPVLEALASHLLLSGLIAGFVFDIIAGRVFANFYALAYASISRSLVHALARLIIALVLIAIIVTAFITLQGTVNWVNLVGAISLGAILGAGFLQVREARSVYRTTLGPAFILSGVSFCAWLIISLLVAGPLFRTGAPVMFVQFENQAIVPKLKDEIAAKLQDLAEAKHERDSVQQKISSDAAQVAAAQAEEKDLRAKMDAWEHSDTYNYSNIGPVRARGDFTTARDLYSAFITQFPNSPLIPAARQQITEIQAAIVARAAQDQAEAAKHQQEMADARAALLAKLKAGTATLSEVRTALLGKTFNDVHDLLGAPSEIASDRWGYGLPMILNPLTNQTTGLAIYFSTGVVQGVDIYNLNPN